MLTLQRVLSRERLGPASLVVKAEVASDRGPLAKDETKAGRVVADPHLPLVRGRATRRSLADTSSRKVNANGERTVSSAIRRKLLLLPPLLLTLVRSDPSPVTRVARRRRGVAVGSVRRRTWRVSKWVVKPVWREPCRE